MGLTLLRQKDIRLKLILTYCFIFIATVLLPLSILNFHKVDTVVRIESAEGFTRSIFLGSGDYVFTIDAQIPNVGDATLTINITILDAGGEKVFTKLFHGDDSIQVTLDEPSIVTIHIVEANLVGRIWLRISYR